MKLIFRFKIIVLVIIFAISSQSFAKDLGVVGQIYQIQEEDLLNFILNRIKTMQQNGEWEKLQNEFKNKVAEHADRPRPLTLISKTVRSKSWNYDPSILVPYDLRDSDGRIFAKAGTTVNPLRYITIHKTLIFFDGDDKDQVNLAEKLDQKLLGKTKLILVSGSVSEQVKRFNKAIYFDQAGKLTTKFNIKHVPAIVSQENLHLKISEIAL